MDGLPTDLAETSPNLDVTTPTVTGGDNPTQIVCGGQDWGTAAGVGTELGNNKFSLKLSTVQLDTHMVHGTLHVDCAM